MDTLALRSPPPLGVLRDDGTIDPARSTDVPGELAVALYEHMVLGRACDEKVVALQREGIVSQHASAAGEEAAIVGAAAAMSDEDWIFPSSREVAAAFWRGMPLVAYAHHLAGTALDAANGRNAPDPPFWRAARVVSVSPLVGTQISHAVGMAWAARTRGGESALVFFGDGATSSGDFHAGLNFAGVARAPLVAVCRNNGWATSTPASRQTVSANFAVKSVAYGLQGLQVDGADVIAVWTVVREARRRAVAGQGATLVEAVIPGLERSDPLDRMRLHLEARGLWSDEREAHLWNDVRADFDSALGEALAAGKPAQGTLFDDVFAELPWYLREQREAR
jgi:2-oxoisovalerate dehydrogenase E1 component alpha subunit